MSGPSATRIAEQLADTGRFLTDDSDTVYWWNEAFWEPLTKPALRRLARQEDEGGSKRDRREEIADHLRACTYRPGLKWGRVADYEIALADCVVDVRTGEPRAHRPEDFLERVLPWPYRPGATCPTWLGALEMWFPGDMAAEVEALQEFFGYIAFSHARYKKALILKGPSNTGKSAVVAVAKNLVGERHACALPLDKMGDPQALGVIIGKALNVVSELPVDAIVHDGGFKQLVSTEDPVFINEKYKTPITYYPTAKHIIATNNLPRINDRTEGMLNRLLIVPMLRILNDGERDRFLEEKLSAEMPGIVLWLIAGAKRLFERGGEFTEVRAGRQMLDELRGDANPIIDFVNERLEIAPPINDRVAVIPLEQIRDEFNHWNSGGAKKATTKGIGKMLRAAGHKVDQARVRVGARSLNVKCLFGFNLIKEKIPAELCVPFEAMTSPIGTPVEATSRMAPPETRPDAGQGAGQAAGQGPGK